MLAVGIDWAEAFHLVALGRPGEGVIQIRRVEHTPAALAELLAHLATLGPDPPRSASCSRPAMAPSWNG